MIFFLFCFVALSYSKLNVDNYLVSFPKSGRTWLRLMIGHALNAHFELQADQADILELDPLNRIAKRKGVENFPTIAVDHAKKELELVSRDKWQLPNQFVNSNVILLVRDPRDVFVSNWFEKAFRKMGLDKKENDGKGFTAENLGEKTADCSWIKEGDGLQNYLSKFEFQIEPFCNETTLTCSCFDPRYTILDFMKEPLGGFDTICHFSTFFYNMREKMASFMIVRYEDMHADPVKELRRVMSFLGVDVSDSVLEKATNESSFDSMRAKEMDGSFGWRLTARNKDDPQTFKTREGKVGNYREHFEKSTLQMMALQMKELLPIEFHYKEADLYD